LPVFVDADALRLQQIHLDLDAVGKTVDLKARRHVAVLAAGLTTVAGAIGAATIGQTAASAGMVVTAGGAAVVATQTKALGELGAQIGEARDQGRQSIERLISREDEALVDGSKVQGHGP
jgi:hypothetical protein